MKIYNKLESSFSKISTQSVVNSPAYTKVNKFVSKNQKRVTLVLIVLASLFFFLTSLGNIIIFTCVCLVYPFIQTIKSVNNNYHGEISKWLIYWLCFSLFYAIQFIVHLFFKQQKYNLLVISLILYLVYSPHMNLTEIIFDNVQGSIIKKFFPIETNVEKLANCYMTKEKLA